MIWQKLIPLLGKQNMLVHWLFIDRVQRGSKPFNFLQQTNAEATTACRGESESPSTNTTQTCLLFETPFLGVLTKSVLNRKFLFSLFLSRLCNFKIT